MPEPSKKYRLVFMGTPEFSVPTLKALYSDSRFEICAVYTQPDRPVGRGMQVQQSPVKRTALEMGLPVFQPEKLTLPFGVDQVLAINHLRELAPDFLVVVAYGQILRKEVIDCPRFGCVNIHSSLLPRWRGAAPIQWAILAGDQKTGVSTMKIVQKLDAGDVLLQAETEISKTDTAQSVHDRLAKMGSELIVPTLLGLAEGSLQAQVQDEAKVTVAIKLSRELEALDVNSKSASALDRQVRALNPWPGTSVYLDVNGKAERLKIKRASSHEGLSIEPGVLSEKMGMLLLGTPSGALEVQVCQLDGKKETDAAGFINGLKGRGLSLPLKTRSTHEENK